MSSFLATSDFRFLTEEEIASFCLSKTNPTDGTGYVLEVDLDYPREMHDLLSDYPIAASLAGERFMAQDKLSPSLYDKSKYVAHYDNLKFYLEAG